MNTKKLEKILDQDGVVFLAYGGLLTQNLIVGMTEALEKESLSSSLNISVSIDIFTIFIEVAQNLMKYSLVYMESEYKALVLVGKNGNNQYYVLGQNIIETQKRSLIATKLDEIISMNKSQIHQKYKELRRNNSIDTKKHSAGIGFYEIAKHSDKIEFSFEKINDQYEYFILKATVNSKGFDHAE